MNCFVLLRRYSHECLPLGVYATYEEALANVDIEPTGCVADEFSETVDEGGEWEFIVEFRDGKPFELTYHDDGGLLGTPGDRLRANAILPHVIRGIDRLLHD